MVRRFVTSSSWRNCYNVATRSKTRPLSSLWPNPPNPPNRHHQPRRRSRTTTTTAKSIRPRSHGIVLPAAIRGGMHHAKTGRERYRSSSRTANRCPASDTNGATGVRSAPTRFKSRVETITMARRMVMTVTTTAVTMMRVRRYRPVPSVHRRNGTFNSNGTRCCVWR